MRRSLPPAASACVSDATRSVKGLHAAAERVTIFRTPNVLSRISPSLFAPAMFGETRGRSGENSAPQPLEAWDQFCYYPKFFDDATRDQVVALARDLPFGEAKIAIAADRAGADEVRRSRIRWPAIRLSHADAIRSPCIDYALRKTYVLNGNGTFVSNTSAKISVCEINFTLPVVRVEC